jgi:hypothetical protein
MRRISRVAEYNLTYAQVFGIYYAKKYVSTLYNEYIFTTIFFLIVTFKHVDEFLMFFVDVRDERMVMNSGRVSS